MQAGLLNTTRLGGAASRLAASRIGSSGAAPIPSIAYIGDSLTMGLCAHYFFNTNPMMRSNARELGAGVMPTDIDGLQVYDGSMTVYDDGTATWTAPGDAPGPRTKVNHGSDRQLVYLESDSPNMGMGVYFTQDMIAGGTEEGNVLNFYVAQDTFSYDSGSYDAWAQALSGWRFDVSGSYGISGDTAEGVLARLGDVFAVNSLGQPITRRPGIVVVNIGINGCDDLDTLDAIKDYIVARGAKVIFCTLAQETPDAPQLAFIESVNTRLASLVDDDTAVADFFDVTMSGGSAIAGRMNDVHYTPAGAQVVGAELVRVFNEMFGTLVGRSSFQSPSEPRNLWPSGMMVGTDGVLTGATGVSGVDAEYSGDGTCVASKEDVTGENPWQVFTITGASLGDTLTLGGNSVPIAVAIGRSVQAELETEVSGDGIAAMVFGTTIYNDQDPPFKAIHAVSMAPNLEQLAPLTDFYVLNKSPICPVTSWVKLKTLDAQFLMWEGDTVIKIRCGGARAIGAAAPL